MLMHDWRDQRRDRIVSVAPLGVGRAGIVQAQYPDRDYPTWLLAESAAACRCRSLPLSAARANW
jgi:hypothetical protein